MKNLILISFAILLLSCVAKKEPQVDPSWSGKMQATAKQFQELLPYIYNEEKFTSKNNRKVVGNKIDRFNRTIHQIKKEQAKLILGDDPHALQGLKNLKELTGRARRLFQKGDFKTSRILLKSTTNTCFQCHTRQNLGPESIRWSHLNIESIETGIIDRAHLLVSMRQYEKAKSELAEYLSEHEDNKKFNLDYEEALRHYLMISLRAQKQWKDSLNFLTSKSHITAMPTQLHFTVQHWLKDLTHWFKQKKGSPNKVILAEAILKRNKPYNNDRNLINNLIASQVLHENLAKNQPKAEKAKSYLLLGGTYDQLITMGYWDLPEAYYETCIRYAPKTELAKTCFKRIRENITQGYSGSRGTFIPAREYKKLEELRKISGLK